MSFAQCQNGVFKKENKKTNKYLIHSALFYLSAHMEHYAEREREKEKDPHNICGGGGSGKNIYIKKKENLQLVIHSFSSSLLIFEKQIVKIGFKC